jgi:flagellar FliL protein
MFNIALLVIIALALLGIVGIVAYKTFAVTGPEEPEIPTAEELQVSQIDLGKMTTNLAGNSLIQANIAIQGDSEKAKEEIEIRKLQVKAIVNGVLHTTTQADIEKPDGLERLVLRIVGELNKVMLEGKVTNVYISDIVVQ